jgi:membrane-bound ClpP family serine protease
MTDSGHNHWQSIAAAAGFDRAATLTPSGSSDLVGARRARQVGRVASTFAAVVVLAAIGLAADSVSAPTGLRWLTGIILLVLLVSTWVLCAHAGGHALFVPLPALALAILWAVTVGEHHGATAWWLVATSAAAAGLGGMVGTTALRQRLRASSSQFQAGLKGASGTAVTPLAPTGVVQMASETWSAVSLSGPLPAGAPVHVVRVDGVRLEVWSEAGAVPDRRSLEDEENTQ